MSDNIKILRNYLLYFLSMILVCIVGISDVFAQTYTLDYNSFVSTAENLSQYIQCNNNQCILYDVPFYNYPMNFEWGTTNSPTCNNTAVVSGTLYVDNTNFGMTNRDYNWNQVFLVNENQYYNCTFNVADNGTSYVCTAPSLSNNFKIGFTLNNTFGTQTTFNSVISRQVDINCDTSTGQIIENQTSNTQNIINNNNTNTENIINNQNQNTQQQIESQKVCSINDKNDIVLDNSYLNNSGYITSNNSYGITDYIRINEKDKLTLLNLSTGGRNANLCFYNINQVLISCIRYGTLIDGDNDITIPNNSSYLRATILKDTNQPQIKICKNGNQALNDSITGLNDSLNDDNSSGATSEASEFFSSFTTNTFGLTSIITAPLNLIQSLTSSSCSELHLPLPYLNNKYLDLPCMTSIYQTHFGAFFTMYQTITYGIIAYWVCVRIFNQVKDFKNPEHDEIEVVDL